MPGLSDQDKDRIRQEEIFRYEVRQQLAATAPDKGSRSKVWATLNSPLVLWFLSTIAIGLVTWGYTQWQTSQTREKEHQIAQLERDLERIPLEVTVRVNLARDNVERATKDQATKRAFYEAISVLDNPSQWGIAEYRKMSLLSILYAAEGLVQPDDREDISKAIAAADQIEAKFLGEHTKSELDELVSHEDVQELHNLLDKLYVSQPLEATLSRLRSAR